MSDAIKNKDEPVIWGNLLHLSYNMWEDRIAPEREFRGYRPFLRCDDDLWKELTEKMAEVGMNMVVIDVGDGIRFRSHPEIPVKGAWPIRKLHTELKRLRKMGLEPIPKLNFSTTHDAWMGPYERCVSTETYYKVCADLIAETIELFDKPRFFHLGMDEETAQHQRFHNYTVLRQFDLWWHDLLFYVREVDKAGARAWVWSDYYWHHPEPFLENMPKSVLQSNWYYADRFDKRVDRVRAYLDFDEHGYDQIPTGSNWSAKQNFPKTVDYLKGRLDRKRLKGFLQTPWLPTIPEYRDKHIEAIDAVREGIRLWEK